MFSFSIRFCWWQDLQTFKSYPERETTYLAYSLLFLMAKAAIAQPSPFPSPTKLIEAKLLVTQAEQKAKGKKVLKKAPAKKAAVKATKAARADDKDDEDVEIVEDDIAVKCVSYIPATFMLLMTYNRWAKKDMHYLTDTLLGLIKDNATWKVTFGFNKGEVQMVKTGGKKLTKHHQAITANLVPGDISG